MFFQKSDKLKNLLDSVPKELPKATISKWKVLNGLSITQILDNCTLDQLDIDTAKLEFKTNVVDGNQIKSGFFK